jgi:hypothetical protein
MALKKKESGWSILLTALLCGFFLWWWFRPTGADLAEARSPEKWASWALKMQMKNEALRDDASLRQEWLILALLAQSTGHESVALIAQEALSPAEKAALLTEPLADDLWLTPPWPEGLSPDEKNHLQRVRQLIDEVQLESAQAELDLMRKKTPALSPAATVLAGALYFSLDQKNEAEVTWATIDKNWANALSGPDAISFLPHLAALPHGPWFWLVAEKAASPAATTSVLKTAFDRASRTLTLSDWIRDGAQACVAPTTDLAPLRETWQAVATQRFERATGLVDTERDPTFKIRRALTLVRALLWMNEIRPTDQQLAVPEGRLGF